MLTYKQQEKQTEVTLDSGIDATTAKTSFFAVHHHYYSKAYNSVLLYHKIQHYFTGVFSQPMWVVKK